MTIWYRDYYIGVKKEHLLSFSLAQIWWIYQASGLNINALATLPGFLINAISVCTHDTHKWHKQNNGSVNLHVYYVTHGSKEKMKFYYYLNEYVYNVCTSLYFMEYRIYNARIF